ncbi:phasin family protein [Candidatus Soleaferrea massiliensis]|uniref:phasin family protein n=1 Tax=Candidatus Soleaferrea massiliensis TaxID=1470354 RepID=UPI00058BA19C|nr:aspartyl beta-hydroxylase [Candidatus Soleaferrea massiliensis]
MNMQDDLKKVLLAGIGALALTAEKSKEVVSQLVQKGELTVEQGKVLNEELKRNVADKLHQDKPKASVLAEELSSMTPEELAALKAKIAELENRDHESEEA